jgi:hypothetical protein
VTDFKESYDYSACTAAKYLMYFHNLQNLFDLEFFQAKLTARAHSITGLEQATQSGLPFWEDGPDDALDGQDEYLVSESDSGEGSEKAEYSKLNDAVETPTRNALAIKIIEKVAKEKKARTQLIQDLDVMKDKFVTWGTQMKHLDHHLDLKTAADFLGEQA